jgi:erythromycin esterase-like protein
LSLDPMLRTRPTRERTPTLATLADAVEPLHGTSHDYDSLLELIGDARIVLIGEASHGTHEFYAERAEITKRLILEKDFLAVCIEGDWPDVDRANRYLQNRGDDTSPAEALDGFTRFPTWMWRNEVVRDFLANLREHNDAQSEDRRVALYGLDLYSMFGSIEAVLAYLDGMDPDAARRARHRYACFDHFAEDSQAYGFAAAASAFESCEHDAVRQLIDLRQNALSYVARDGIRAADDFFSAEQNAKLVHDAEYYYRAMFRGRVSSWNLRDRHMMDTLEAVERHLNASRWKAKLVVWAHNSHVGDARYTDMSRRGELNLGQLARQRWRGDVCIVGFSTHMGTVTAAHDWEGVGLRRRVRQSLDGSYEQLFHQAALRREASRVLLRMREETAATRVLLEPRLQRAIGVVYRPETERMSHYYDVTLPLQFDAIIHVDETSALRALEPGERWEQGIEEPPETYPSGL